MFETKGEVEVEKNRANRGKNINEKSISNGKEKKEKAEEEKAKDIGERAKEKRRLP